MTKKPDIIVINPDQMRADALHHLGNEASHTLNMDLLAREGVSFSSAFCQNPVCVDRKSTRLNSSHTDSSRMPSSA